MSIFKNKLNKAKEVYEDMTLLIKICKESNSDVWGVYWEAFWEVSREFPFEIEWHDPDTSYQEDIMARYMVIGDFMENINDVLDGESSE